MASLDFAADETVSASLLLRLDVETFLFQEAELLDDWRLTAWLALMRPDIIYAMPAPDKPDGDPGRDLFLVHDDAFLLRERVNQLLGKATHSEVPRSQTRRMISNVRALRRPDGEIDVKANFVVYRSQREVMDVYNGEYQHRLVIDGGSFKFRHRKAVLSFSTLRRQGKISIIV